MSFTLVRYRLSRAVPDCLHCSMEHPDLHHVAAVRLYRTKDNAQTVADRLNRFKGFHWEVEPVYIQMTEAEHDAYDEWLRWSE